MPLKEPPTEGIFVKIFVGWVVLVVIFYIWSYVREGKFLGEDYYADLLEEPEVKGPEVEEPEVKEPTARKND